MARLGENAVGSEGPALAAPTGGAEPVQSPHLATFKVTGMTCGSCVWHVEGALNSVPGVKEAKVSLAAGAVAVTYDSTTVTFSALQEAVSDAGYGLSEPSASGDSKASGSPGRRIPGWPLAAGTAAAAFLTGFYIALVSLAQGFDHALELITGDWYFVGPIVLGFGTQMGLFFYLRAKVRLRQGTGTTKALAGAGTGTSTVSMVACCAHHLTDVLPIVGLSGAALFLNEFRGPLMGVGILTNGVGIWVMLRVIRKSNQCGTVPGDLPSGSGAG